MITEEDVKDLHEAIKKLEQKRQDNWEKSKLMRLMYYLGLIAKNLGKETESSYIKYKYKQENPSIDIFYDTFGNYITMMFDNKCVYDSTRSLCINPNFIINIINPLIREAEEIDINKEYINCYNKYIALTDELLIPNQERLKRKE